MQYTTMIVLLAMVVGSALLLEVTKEMKISRPGHSHHFDFSALSHLPH